MVVDVSHLAEAGFWDVMEISTKPVIASHSNSKALLLHPRNLTDDQARATRPEKGGVDRRVEFRRILSRRGKAFLLQGLLTISTILERSSGRST